MKYDIYFHGNCFDGVASAAMLKYFLNLRGDDFDRYFPVTHPVDKAKWSKLSLGRSFAVADIFYHPNASYWFDHHPTTFMNKKWESSFKADSTHAFDVKSDSCTGLIFRHFSKQKKVKHPKHITELAKWADIVDHDLLKVYKTPKDAVQMSNGPVGIAKSFIDKEPDGPYAKYLIKALASESFEDIAKHARVNKRIQLHRKRVKDSFSKMEDKVVLRGVTAILYGMSEELSGARFASYYFYPEAKYSIRLVKRGKNYVASTGVNPWNKPKNPANIGKYLHEKFGGGGHAYAASASFKTKEGALKGALDIADYLNKHA